MSELIAGQEVTTVSGERWSFVCEQGNGYIVTNNGRWETCSVYGRYNYWFNKRSIVQHCGECGRRMEE